MLRSQTGFTQQTCDCCEGNVDDATYRYAVYMYHLQVNMSAKSSPDPDFTKACALLKKKIEKSMRAPLDALPSTRMCFSGRCHPLGLTIKTACCNTTHNSLKQHIHDTWLGECY